MALFRKKKKEEAIMAKSYSAWLTGDSKAMANSTFWCCVVSLASLEASLPLQAYKRTSTGKVKLEDDAMLSMLLREPNPYMTPYEFNFIMGMNFELHGEAIAIIQRYPRTGRVISLDPISPASLIAHIKDDRIYYRDPIHDKDYSSEDLLIIKQTPNGYTSVLSPMDYAKDDIELEAKSKKLQEDYYKGGTIVGNLIKVPSSMTKEQRDEIKVAFDSARGFRNSVIDSRIEVARVQVPASDLDVLIKAHDMTRSEIANRFRVPGFFVGDTHQTYANAEQQGLQMVTYCLEPRLKAWEDAFNRWVCQGDEYVKFNFRSLMRGDHASRSAYYHGAITDGYYSINEIRALEDMDGIGPDGDVHYFPLNYANLHAVATGATSTDPWDAPVDSESIQEKAIIVEDSKTRDLRLISEAQKPAKTARRELQKVIKTQLKKEIEELNRLVATGADASIVLSDWKEWLEKNATELQPQMKNIYLDVIKKMLPSIQSQTKANKPVNDGAQEEFINAYADSFCKRHAGRIYKDLSKYVGTDELESTEEELMDVLPVTEAKHESNRSTNAFSVFLYSQLGVEKMKVVAQLDCCDICSKVDGKVVSVNGYVLKKGDAIDGEDEVIHINKNYKHPPFHAGCECGVVASD